MNVAFLGSGRCFHTMDWFRSCKRLCATQPAFITDNYGKEGFVELLEKTDSVHELFIIDPLLPKTPSVLGHRWRNLLKLVLIPIQVFKLRRVLRKLDRPFVFAHSTYYAFLASFCGVPYCATPQGSEVLVRPGASKFYRYFLSRSVRHASFVTVDSVAMSNQMRRLTDVTPEIVQNGIDIASIAGTAELTPRTLVMSIRGLSDNYRIAEIVRGRDSSAPETSLNFSFPFVEEGYVKELESMVGPKDVFFRDLSRAQLYDVFRRSICVVSIPRSDSSPRSVYEAIFCGAAVICTQASFVDNLPACMRQRLIVVDLANPAWFSEGYRRAVEISSVRFIPSPEALELFDQVSSMKKCLEFAASKQRLVNRLETK